MGAVTLAMSNNYKTDHHNKTKIYNRICGCCWDQDDDDDDYHRLAETAAADVAAAVEDDDADAAANAPLDFEGNAGVAAAKEDEREGKSEEKPMARLYSASSAIV